MKLKVIVVGEGKDERGHKRTVQIFGKVAHKQQGAMEILVRRAMFQVRHPDQEWSPVADLDEVEICEPPTAPGRVSMMQALVDENLLAQLVSASLNAPSKSEPKAHLFVATHDDDTADKFRRAVGRVRAKLGKAVPMMIPVPHIQSWLASKLAVEAVFNQPHCTVPLPDERRLRKDAKEELKLMLGTFGTFDATHQARLAEVVPVADLEQFEWTGWKAAREEIASALKPLLRSS
jgi:hypothetical protein